MVGIPSRAKAPWSTSRFARSPSDISQQTFYFFVCEAAEPCNLLSGTVITAFQYLRQSHSLRCIQATQPHIAEQLTAKSISVFPHFLNWNAQTSHGTAATVYVRLFCKAQKIVETSVTAEYLLHYPDSHIFSRKDNVIYHGNGIFSYRNSCSDKISFGRYAIKVVIHS